MTFDHPARAIAAGGTDGYAISVANMIVARTPSTTQMLSNTASPPEHPVLVEEVPDREDEDEHRDPAHHAPP